MGMSSSYQKREEDALRKRFRRTWWISHKDWNAMIHAMIGNTTPKQDTKERVVQLLVGRGYERPAEVYDRLKYWAGAGTVKSRIDEGFQKGGADPWRALEKLLRETKQEKGASLWDALLKRSPNAGPAGAGPKEGGKGAGGKGAGGNRAARGGKADAGAGGPPPPVRSDATERSPGRFRLRLGP